MEKDELLEAILLEKEIKPTTLRLYVLRLFITNKIALSLQVIENYFGKVDKVTLFRTIRTFIDKKIIHTIEDGSKSSKYAIYFDKHHTIQTEDHPHFICRKCEQIYCLEKEFIPELNIPASFDQNQVNLLVHGLCSKCNIL